MKDIIDVSTPVDTGTEVVPYTEQEDTVEDLLFEFLRSRSPTTERSYRADLKEFFRFTQSFFKLPRIEGAKVHFEDIKRVHVVKYRTFLETQPSKTGKPFAPNSVNRKLASIGSFYRFLQQREVVEKNPLDFCTRPKRINVRDTVAFDETEMRQFFALIMRKANPMHKALLLLLFTTGMRNHEARNIKLKDFESQEGVKTLRYVGKGQKVHRVPIHPATGYHLGQYLAWMEQNGRPIQPDDYLFQSSKKVPGRENSKLSHTALGYIVKKWARKVNNSKRITPHSARATFITCLLARGEDIYTVAQAVNHASVNTTSRYNKRKQSIHKSLVFTLNFFE